MFGQVLRGDAHVVIVEGIPEAVVQHAVEQILVAHAQALAGLRQYIGRLAHRLLATGDHHLGIAAANGLGRQMHGLESRTADLVDGQGRHCVGQPGLDRRLTRRVLPGAGRQYLAHDHLANLMAGQPRAVEQATDHQRPQLDGGDASQRTLEATNGGARGGNYYYIVHCISHWARQRRALARKRGGRREVG
ncbi:hypothetical protein D3C80_1278420 [compost metagenome]